jgi:predicted dehydrogenase
MSEFIDLPRRRFLGKAGLWGTGLMASWAMSSAAGGAPTKPDVPLAPPDKQPENLKLPRKPEKTIGWAVVGLGQLAVEEILPAFAHCKFSKLTALVSGHRDKAERLAAYYGVKEANLYDYETYDKLAANPDVDAIFIVLPNSMHAEFTIRGFKAGKHVLCEKPMAASVSECEQMIAAGKSAKKQLMIAYRLHYEPFNQMAIKLCREEIGELRSISASNCQVVDAPNIRLSKKLAGGPLGDIGVYCLQATRYLTGLEPVEVTAMNQSSQDPRFREVPEGVSFHLRFPNEITANCDCNFDAAESRHFRVQGTKGYVDLDQAFSYRGQVLKLSKDKKVTQIPITPVDHFAAEMEHFSECLLTDKPNKTPGEEGLQDMRLMAAIEQAATSGKPVKIDS